MVSRVCSSPSGPLSNWSPWWGLSLKAARWGPLLSFVDLVLPFLSVPSAPPLPPFFCFSSSKSLLCIWESHTFSLLLCLGFVSKLSSSQSRQRNPAEMHSGIPVHPLRFPSPLDFQVKSLMVRIQFVSWCVWIHHCAGNRRMCLQPLWKQNQALL